MPAMTLYEASKLVSGEVKRAAIIDIFAEESELMRVVPFMDVPGLSYTYNLTAKLPGMAFRGVNESYSASVGVINPRAEILRIGGGDLDVDRAIIKGLGDTVRATHEELQVRSLSRGVADAIINGDSLSDAREFDGLRARITGTQLLPANSGAPSANSPLSLEALDAALDAVPRATHIIGSTALKRRIVQAARAGLGGDYQVTQDTFGNRVESYNGIPLVAVDYANTDEKIIDFNEAGPAGGTTATSLYVVRFGDGFVSGLQNGIMEVRDLGETDDAPVMRTRVEWMVGLAVMHPRACARVWGITNAAVTA